MAENGWNWAEIGKDRVIKNKNGVIVVKVVQNGSGMGKRIKNKQKWSKICENM